MADLIAPGVGEANPSQTGGPGIQLGQPVNGTATPPVSQDTPPVDVNDPVAVAEAALAQAKADAAAKSGTPPVAAPDPVAGQVAQPQVEVVPSTQDGDVVVYDPTGDAGLDMALGFMGQLNIPGNDPAMIAAANGDFTILEAKLAVMGDKAKGWEQHVALGKQAFARQLDVYKAEQAKTTAAVHSVAGGEEQWKAILAWAGTAATPDEKKALNEMFDAGPVQAQMAARAIVAAHREATGTTIKPANPAPSASGVAIATDPKQLTSANYYKDVDALYRQMGNRMDGSPEYTALKQKYFGR